MIGAARFFAAARVRRFGLYTGVPCSYLTPFINHAINAPDLRYIAAANEGDAVAIAAGAALGGVPSVAMFQNSGLGNAVNPLTSLTHTARIPVLLVVTWRGEPGGAADEPQHELMGRITTGLLERMEIPWRLFPATEAEIGPALDEAVAHMERHRRPFALLMRKGSVAGDDRSVGLPPRPLPTVARRHRDVATARRRALLQAVRSVASAGDVLVATTGYTGRELYALGDSANQFYMVGSMGCALSFGLGLARARPQRRIIVLDGDGALLMRLGALGTVGFERPANLLHVLLDNGQHESTGGQATVSASLDFINLALACGYPAAATCADPAALAQAVADRAPGLRFLHVPVLPGVPDKLPRPAIGPAEVAARLQACLEE